MARKSVLLVVGAPHSGTTILDAALGVSPQVVGVGEAVRLTSGVNTDHLEGEGGRRICTCGMPAIECPVWSEVLPHLSPDITVRSHFPFVDRAARDLSSDVRYVLDSSPNAAEHAEELSEYDVRVIQVTRDVRSWVASRRKRKADTLVSAYVTWWRNVTRVEAEVTRLALPRFRLGYEELALRPRETLTLLCDWLGVPFDEAMLAPFGNTGSHIITGNGSIRKRTLAAKIRYDGSWLAAGEYPLASALLTGCCAHLNQRLVYANGVLKRRG